MKIYFDLAKKCLKEVDTENQVIFTGDVLVSKLEVISSAPTTAYYVVVSAKLSNGRTIGPFLYDENGVETDSHCTKWTFTLSSANGFTLTKGIVNFYVWLVPANPNDLNKKCIGAVAVNVGEAYGFEDSYFVELDSESSDVIANMSAQIHQLQTLIQSVNAIEANPTGEATQDLLTIKIGSVTYSITEFRKFSQNDKFGDVIDEYLETDAPPFTANRQINLICEETGVFCHLEGYQSGVDTYVELYVFGSDVAHITYKNPNSTILNYTMSQIIQGTTATSVASLTGLKNEVATLGATKENKKIDYIIYVTETYNQQTQEFEFTKTGEYGTFPFLFDDESDVDDLRKDLECLRVCIYVDTTRTSHAGQNIDVIELSLHRLSHPDDDSSTSAVFIGQQISGTNTNASIYQFEVDFCQDGMSDGGTENIDRYTLFNYKELHYVHTDNNFTNAYKTAVTKQGYDSSTDTFTPTAKINASNVDVVIKALKTYIDNGGANPVLLDSYLNDLEMILTAFPTGADATNKLATKNDLSTVYKYKGSVSNYSDLPSSGQKVGDTYNIANADSTHGIKAGDNVAWNGTAWDPLAGTVDLSGYQTKIDSSHKLSSALVDDTNKANRFVKAYSGVQKIQEGDNTEYGKVEVANNKAQLHAYEDTEGTGDVTATNSNVSVSYTTDYDEENTRAESTYNNSGVVHQFTDANGDTYSFEISDNYFIFKKNSTELFKINNDDVYYKGIGLNEDFVTPFKALGLTVVNGALCITYDD